LAEGEVRPFEKLLKKFEVFESAGLGLEAGRKVVEAAGKEIERLRNGIGIFKNGLRRFCFQ
jgi:hypothetical protein